MPPPRFFCTAGTIDQEIHYFVEPLSRLNLDEIRSLIDRRSYFVLHAPRQTGKTTCLKALVQYLNALGCYRAYYANLEGGQFARENVEEAFKVILGEIANRAEELGEPRLLEFIEPVLEGRRPAINRFSELLKYWSKLDYRPLVLFLDEVDALVGDTLIALLRLLRAGYDKRPQLFPASVVLCGVRDVRDYRLYSSVDKTVITGGSAFNIKSKSLRLGNLSPAEVYELLGQHTRATGQAISEEAMRIIWDLTCGQPWLVNALAYQACFEDSRALDRAIPIDGSRIDDAKEALILRRDTHLDQLTDKLREERVRRVIQPIFLGNWDMVVQPDDIQYSLDLGLIRQTEQGAEIANPIYREIIPRELMVEAQESLKSRFFPDWITPDGTLDTPKLLSEFQDFYCENGEAWAGRLAYREAGPQLLLQAFLQRVANGQGRIEREYALGTGRTDLFLKWPHASGVQKIVLELKVLHKSLERTVSQGLRQVAAYADRCQATETHLLVFTSDQELEIKERVFHREENYQGRKIMVWGM